MKIAEIGWNFMGDIQLAEKMIEAAASAGATHVKFQYWRESNLKNGKWDEDGRREIYKSAQLDDSRIDHLNRLASNYNVGAFYSAFSQSGLKQLHKVGQRVIKIPSHEIYNLDLIKTGLELFDKVILSTGACSEKELIAVSELCKKYKCHLVVMHCVSSYPCSEEVMNLPRINSLKALFPGAEMGLSDHTSSKIIPAISAAFGVSVVEKHFTTDHSLPGRDNQFALLPQEFSEMSINFKQSHEACIYRGMDAQESEEDIMKNYRGRWGSN